MDNQFEPLNNDEVLFINVGRVLMVNPTFKVGEFIDALAQAISDRESDWSDDNEGWFGEGLPCEALRFGTAGWQRGRVRLRLEFSPEVGKPKMLDVPRDKPRRSEKPSPKVDDIYGDEVDDDY
ncbi:MAG: KGK domain-containing protein [Tildeniella nuda ZEHNDER 1965/U140]|nr:KGK domain-containing protein [Tildeniella nuda ZEHNDER 1965/U140]